MDTSISALVIAVVGVVGTLLSGLLAHRSALRAKSIDIAHTERQQRKQELAQERRESHDARRATYTALNQALRQFHAILFREHRARAEGVDASSLASLAEQREEARGTLRDVYAEAQMVVPDDVLTISGRVVHQLFRVHTLLSRENPSDEALRDVAERLSRTSELLYEVRQTMRKDLGITALPIERPGDYLAD